MVQRLPPAEPPPRLEHPEHLGKGRSRIVDVMDSTEHDHLVERRVGERQTRCIPLKELNGSRGSSLRAALSIESDTSTPIPVIMRSFSMWKASPRPQQTSATVPSRPDGRVEKDPVEVPVVLLRVWVGEVLKVCGCDPIVVILLGFRLGRTVPRGEQGDPGLVDGVAAGCPRSRPARLRPASGPHQSRGISSSPSSLRPAMPGAHRPSPPCSLPVHAPHGSKCGKPPLKVPRFVAYSLSFFRLPGSSDQRIMNAGWCLSLG